MKMKSKTVVCARCGTEIPYTAGCVVCPICGMRSCGDVKYIIKK